MHGKRRGALSAKGLFCIFLASMIYAPVSAHPIYFLPSSVAVLASASLTSEGHCVYLTYDKNGNRLARSSAVISVAPASWGASVYGCSRWGVSS